MIIDLNKSAAFVCPCCISVTNKEISLFDITKNSRLDIPCTAKDCNTTPVSISKRNNAYTIKVQCPICPDEHTFTYSCAKVIKSQLIIFKCPNTMENIAALGSEDYIDEALEDMSDISLISASDRAEFADYELLYRMVDKLSDLNEQSMIKCACGNFDIDLDIDETQIVLTCTDCKKSMRLDINEQSLGMLLGTVSLFIK